MNLNLKNIPSTWTNHISSFFQIFIHMFLIYLTMFYYYHIPLVLNKYILLFYFIAIIFIGTRMRALGNIIHECSHFSFVPNKKINIFYGNLLSILEFSSFEAYQKQHFMHHKYLGVENKDQDYNKYMKLIKPFRNKTIFDNFFVLFCLIVLNPLNWIYYIISNLHFFETNKIINFTKITYILALFFLCLVPNSNKFLLFLVIPYLTTYQIMKISSDFLDHHKVYFDSEKFFKTRNHMFKNKLLNLIFFPRNDSYHLVHHMYPSAPIKILGKIHNLLLQENLKYRSRKHDLF